MDKNQIKTHQKDLAEIKKEIGKAVIGQEKVIEGCLRAILANGHLLIEGVPGIAKTLLIRALAQASGCKFNRIQFTVDLLPTDIVGITAYNKDKGFYTIKGPVFANFVIADEINRAPPKTQSALLEAMQEKQVTIGKETFSLELPFFVMANNNPIESGGTYQLPEAQIDRFLIKLNMGYPTAEEEQKILKTNISLNKFEDFKINAAITPKKIIEMQKTTKEIFLSEDIEKYIVELVDATRNPEKYKIKTGKYIEYGCSPRAAIGLFIVSKADALMNGKSFVTPQNVKNIAHDVMRHRLILNYEGQAEGIKADDIITEILSKVAVP
ncbi:MAG: MoxR family ATPase [Nanoarchaeota archaeon]|nr:MoxR family ATPase [Nanoarchaeota archaeon]MBU1005527.1 MoxR family ATPase [Nanoarchaeota archaeon]MBU1945866.1 MoxR family ATPase [Nanoarchaeota archaeon]